MTMETYNKGKVLLLVFFYLVVANKYRWVSWVAITTHWKLMTHPIYEMEEVLRLRVGLLKCIKFQPKLNPNQVCSQWKFQQRSKSSSLKHAQIMILQIMAHLVLDINTRELTLPMRLKPETPICRYLVAIENPPLSETDFLVRGCPAHLRWSSPCDSSLHWSFWSITQCFSAQWSIFHLYLPISYMSSLSVAALTNLRSYISKKFINNKDENTKRHSNTSTSIQMGGGEYSIKAISKSKNKFKYIPTIPWCSTMNIHKQYKVHFETYLVGSRKGKMQTPGCCTSELPCLFKTFYIWNLKFYVYVIQQ